MGLATRLVEARGLENPKVPLSSASVLSLFGVGSTATGKTVTAEGSLRIPVVYRCVGLLAGVTAVLPLHIYERLASGGKRRAPEHPTYALHHSAPNPEMTAFERREIEMGHLLLWGNAYSEIVRDGAGRVRELWPLRPDKMAVERVGGSLVYWYTLPSGERVALPRERVHHVRALGTDGLVGLSPIGMAREAVGLALATEEYGGRFFGNGSSPDGILTHPKSLSEAAQKRLKASWEAAHQGLSNSHRVAVLEEGVTWQAVGIPPEDAQFLETRKFQRSEIAMLYGIPPHLVGDTERSTSWGTGIEQQSIGFVTYTLLPLLKRLEQAHLRDLFTAEERQTYFTEHLVDGLLRGDAKARAEALHIQLQDGVINADEWRELENMNPQPNGQGQIYLVNGNMIPKSQAGQKPAAPAENGGGNG